MATLFSLLALPFAAGDWVLTFADEFDTLNLTTWSVADNYTHTWPYSGTSELQLYTKDEVFVENGSLVLQTRATGRPSRAHTAAPRTSLQGG